MKFMQRLLLMLAVIALGLAVVATRSTAEGPGAPWAPECWECGPVLNGDPDGGSATRPGFPPENESYRLRSNMPRPSVQQNPWFGIRRGLGFVRWRMRWLR